MHASIILRTSSLSNRPARYLYMIVNNDVERIVAMYTIRQYINKYGFNDIAKHNLETKRQAIRYYLDAIINDRYSMIAVADSLLESIITDDALSYGYSKAIISSKLGYSLPYDITIEEWRGYLEVIKKLNKNDKIQDR